MAGLPSQSALRQHPRDAPRRRVAPAARPPTRIARRWKPPSRHALRPKRKRNAAFKCPFRFSAPGVAPPRTGHFKAAAHVHAPRAGYAGRCGALDATRCHADCFGRPIGAPALRFSGVPPTASPRRSCRAARSPRRALRKRGTATALYRRSVAQRVVRVRHRSGFADSPLRGAVPGFTPPGGGANSLFHSAARTLRAAGQRSAAAVFGLRPHLNGRYAPSRRGGRPRQCCFPPPGFPPCTPLSGRPPFKQGIRQGGKPSWGATARRPLRRGWRLGAFSGAKTRLAPSLAARRRPSGCRMPLRRSAPLVPSAPAGPGTLVGDGARLRLSPPRRPSMVFATLTLTNFPPLRHRPPGGGARSLCSGAPALARKSACKARRGGSAPPTPRLSARQKWPARFSRQRVFPDVQPHRRLHAVTSPDPVARSGARKVARAFLSRARRPLRPPTACSLGSPLRGSAE